MDKFRSTSERFSGVLLHPTSLPGKGGCGGFGDEAKEWLKLLADSGISVWQVLPLSPPDSTGSPYSSPSSFALNPYFLDVKSLVREGYLPKQIVDELTAFGDKDNYSFEFEVANSNLQIIGRALRESWANQRSSSHKEFLDWSSSQFWLEDHVFFMELRRQHNELPWWEWPLEFASHKTAKLKAWKVNCENNLLEHSLIQWHLNRQWSSIKSLAKDLGILIFGDLPFYVSRDSADVWGNRSLFSIFLNGSIHQQSGVPPDYFSETGQLWGTPVYRWDKHIKTHFRWWRERVSRQWSQVDLLRLDHFRALNAFWSVPGDRITAQNGFWSPSPGLQLLKVLRNDYGGKLPLVAEDLGIITPQVEQLRDFHDLPGMKILQFAFDGNMQNPYLPENINNYRSVVYTGTHDNATTKGWWEDLDCDSKSRVLDRVNGEMDSPSWKMIEMGLRTNTFLFIAPLVDLLELDNNSRFNTPGTVEGNWSWRLSKFDNHLLTALDKYGSLGRSYGRSFENVFSILG